MNAARRRGWLGVVVAVVVVAATVAVLMIPGRRVRTDSQNSVSARVRAITLALIVYSQNNGDAFPPPEHAIALLAASGSIDPAIAEPPAGRRGEPAFFLVMPESSTGKWSNSFVGAQPLVIANPAVWGEAAGTIGYSDNHPEFIRGDEFQKVFAKLQPRLVPLR